ncbi:MAG: BON domain-containing protein [Gemmatimonadota bacterium]|nr:MAG: BON domain-containing protein [Gemmatimonadota bacterium]
MTPRDLALHLRVLTALESEPSLIEHEIGVAVRGGVVTLSGSVDNCEQKRAAERAALAVRGVEVLAEGLEVRPPGQRDLTDTAIARKVADHLEWQSLFPDEEVKAKVEDGWVTLEGDVELFHHRAAAETYIRQVPGVRGITNLITVKPPESVEDIRAKAEAALGRRAQPQGPDRPMARRLIGRAE